MSTPATSWFESWFNEDYLAVYSHRTGLEAEADVDRLAGWLPIRDRQSALDLGCGAGRHLPPLAKYVKRVIGIDLSAVLVREAVSFCGKRAEVVRGDFRALPFRAQSFDFASCFFTGFGYLDSDDEHEALLREWRRVLRSDGLFILDYIFKPAVLKSLEKISTRQIGKVKVSETRSLSSCGRRVEKEIALLLPGGERKCYRESVRLYDSVELVSMLERAGFTDIRLSKDFSGAPPEETVPRLIAAAGTNS